MKRDLEKALNVYVELQKQTSQMKSTYLRTILEMECHACLRMSDAFLVYTKLSKDKMNEQNKLTQSIYTNAAEFAREITDAYMGEEAIQHAHAAYDVAGLLDELNEMAYNAMYSSFLIILSRDYRDWKKIAFQTVKSIGETIIGLVPALSVWSLLADIGQQAHSFCTSVLDDGTEYSELDKQLCIIEQHTMLAQKAAEIFEQSAAILSDTPESEKTG